MSTRHITIDLVPGEVYYRDQYGILLVSEAEHVFAGRGVHNQGMGHILQVWDNIGRPALNGSGTMKDPMGNLTDERYSFLWSPQATVIALRDVGGRKPRGEALTIGDLVTLRISGFEIGTFQIRARPLHNPHMVQVDTASSGSRQHFIDTGEYLAVRSE